MNIQTSRFGCVEVEQGDMINFSEGILGFSHLRQFVILDDPTDEIFAWLQSCEQADVAFPVLEPELFVEDYRISLGRRDKEALDLSDEQRPRVFTIVTIPEDPSQMTANLKAPIVLNVPDRKGCQCVLQDNKLAIREPIFAKLQQRFVQTKTSMKVQAEDIAVRLPIKERQSEI